MQPPPPPYHAAIPLGTSSEAVHQCCYCAAWFSWGGGGRSSSYISDIYLTAVCHSTAPITAHRSSTARHHSRSCPCMPLHLPFLLQRKDLGLCVVGEEEDAHHSRCGPQHERWSKPHLPSKNGDGCTVHINQHRLGISVMVAAEGAEHDPICDWQHAATDRAPKEDTTVPRYLPSPAAVVSSRMRRSPISCDVAPAAMRSSSTESTAIASRRCHSYTFAAMRHIATIYI